MVLEEIYRFENGMIKKDGELCREFDRLFKEVVNGLKKCKEIGKLPVSMGVDTWGVDFVLPKMTKFLEIQWDIVITVQREWTKKFIRLFP